MATNPYYQREFDASGGQLARSSLMRREFELIQKGFDLIGLQNSIVKYQLSCSDLFSDLIPGQNRAYLRTTDPMTLLDVRGSLLQASEQGSVRVNLVINGYQGLFRPLQIDEGQKTSVTSSAPASIAYPNLPDDSEVVIDILGAGFRARGLIVTLIGVRTGS